VTILEESLMRQLHAGFLPVRAWSSTVLVRTGAGGAVPASGWYQVVQYGGRRGTGSTGTETVLKRVCCLGLQGKHIFVPVHQTHQCIIRPDGKHNKYVVK
jgi:hypothetical protein